MNERTPGSTTPPAGDAVAWVDPNIGGVAHLLAPTVPTVQRPGGMVRLAPNRPAGHPDPWLADHVTGFPLNIIGHRGPRAFAIMAASGQPDLAPGGAAALADHDFETAAPERYTAALDDGDLEVAFTATRHAMAYRFTFQAAGPHWLIFHTTAPSALQAHDGGRTVTGEQSVHGLDCFFWAQLPPGCAALYAQDEGGEATEATEAAGTAQAQGNGAALAVGYNAREPWTAEVTVGFSYISAEQARQNAGEALGHSFESLCTDARAAWNRELGRIHVEGGDERQRRVFYTALWRAMERPVDIAEGGRYYSAWDGKIHDAGGAPFFVDDWMWDTHRGVHPLHAILNPTRQRDILNSYARMIAQGEGWAPTFPQAHGNNAAMLGNHLAAVAADAWAKGIRDFDVETVYTGLRKTAMEGSRIPWYVGPATELDRFYLEKGYFPALAPGQREWVSQVHDFERRQAVSVTLDHAYDDWCLSTLAEGLGHSEDAQALRHRALYYRNLWRADLGVMAPRTADGTWVQPFDPGLYGGAGGRDAYAECNGWVWSWSVPHDVAGLMALMGGREAFAQRLDALYNQPLGTSKYQFLGQFPDSTGLVGQFPMGNEPGFLIPWLHLYAGQPWRTQHRVRQLMDLWFDDGPFGLCGDDDGGALSAWYVFGALGFYPLCPGRPVYGVGSPIFERAAIQLGNGGAFTVAAPGASRQNKYVQSARLNGQELTRPWFTHDHLIPGGCLELDMGPRPNRLWGSGPQDAPPSFCDKRNV